MDPRAIFHGSVAVVALGFSFIGWVTEEEHVCDASHESSEAPAATQKRGRFEVLSDVSLSQNVTDKLNLVAEKFTKKTGRTFVVTSGTRDPVTQAELIYDKLNAGDDIMKLYKDKAAVAELITIYNAGQGAKRSRSTVVASIAAAIRAQIKKGVFISAHLKAGAADVRSTTMSPADKRAFVDAVREAGGFDVMFESTPPHFHLQLD
jgi:hypothetical protein